MSENQNPEGETPDESMKRLQGEDSPPAGWGASTPPPTTPDSPYGDLNENAPPPPPPPYGQPAEQPYGQAPYGQPYPQQYGGPMGNGKQDHPQTVTILVLGIISLMCCGLLGPVVWWMGNNARKESLTNPGLNENNTTLTIGWVLGIIASGLLVVGVLFYGLGITSALIQG